jgi:diacylglycerol kinase (ATP)
VTLPSPRLRPATRTFSLRNRLASFRYAASGLILLVRREPNARIHLAATLIIMATGTALRVSVADWCWLVGAMAGVWMAEAFNTAIEVLCDRVCQERDPAIGQAKDLAAGGVLIASIAAGAIGLLVFLPHLTQEMADFSHFEPWWVALGRLLVRSRRLEYYCKYVNLNTNFSDATFQSPFWSPVERSLPGFEPKQPKASREHCRLAN